MLGLQAVELVSAQAGDEVNAYVDLVPGVRVLGDVRLGDVLNPVLKPALDGPTLPRLPKLLVVAGPLHLADGLGHLGLCLPLDVTAVGLSVITDTDGHPAVPLSVLAEVDGRGPVGLTGALVLWHACPPQAAWAGR